MRWFEHAEGTQDEEFIKKVYNSMTKGVGVKGRSPVVWGNRVEEYLGGEKWGKNAWYDVCEGGM